MFVQVSMTGITDQCVGNRLKLVTIELQMLMKT